MRDKTGAGEEGHHLNPTRGLQGGARGFTLTHLITDQDGSDRGRAERREECAAPQALTSAQSLMAQTELKPSSSSSQYESSESSDDKRKRLSRLVDSEEVEADEDEEQCGPVTTRPPTLPPLALTPFRFKPLEVSGAVKHSEVLGSKYEMWLVRAPLGVDLRALDGQPLTLPQDGGGGGSTLMLKDGRTLKFTSDPLDYASRFLNILDGGKQLVWGRPFSRSFQLAAPPTPPPPTPAPVPPHVTRLLTHVGRD